MVQGLAAFEARFAAIPLRVRARVQAAMEKVAEEIVADMRRLVRKRRDRRLERSIGWTWGEAPAGSFVIGQVGRADYGSLRLTIYAGGREAFYARFVEFGTRPHSLAKGARKQNRAARMGGGYMHPGARPFPFFYPAWRLWKRKVKSRISAAMRQAIRES